jgi:cell wall-associated NlpC family hydrolase
VIVDDILAEARSWIGTPWHHRARVKGAGVDCVMLLAEVYERVGVIPHVEPEYYPIDIMMHRGRESVIAWLVKFGDEAEDPRPGDAVVWRFARFFSHAGIVSGDGTAIHAYRPFEIVAETPMNEGNLADRDRRYFRFREA